MAKKRKAMNVLTEGWFVDEAGIQSESAVVGNENTASGGGKKIKLDEISKPAAQDLGAICEEFFSQPLGQAGKYRHELNNTSLLST